MKLRELFEAPATAVMAFGRMNPPTIGHAKLVDAIKSQPGDPFIFLSQSQKPKTDPLSFEDKLRYAKFFFPNVTIGNPEVKTIIQALQKVESLGYQQLIYVAGSDRVQAFEELLNKYNGKDFTFKSIKVVSAGERDPDADGAEGMSASKMRAAAAEGDLESFKQGVPEPKLADEMFAAVRKGMNISEDGRTIRIPSLTAQPHLAGLEDPDGDYDDSELRVYTKSYRDMYKKAKDAQAKADATGGPGASYQTKARDVTVSKEVLPKRTKPKKPRT
jgi:nicotinic acid mononucleotide adenylyltransferase